jgi:hypothetical protein
MRYHILTLLTGFIFFSCTLCTAENLGIDTGSDTAATIDARINEAQELLDEGRYYRSMRQFASLKNLPLSPEQKTSVDLGIITTRKWWYKFLLSRVLFLTCIFFISLGMYLAHKGHVFTIRKIPGLDQIKEAVGRATEMGRPSLFCIGVSNMDHPETFAAMPILSHIARISATLRNRLLIPICAERTLTLQQTTYREACQAVGELRSYNPSDIRFFPGGQVYFTAATMGYMLRERPAACFYFGYWEAESLLLSETGQVIGAMQIAGTSQLFQIPFFIAACDYVIIGEEFFAVSASLSREPVLSGSLFGQDIVKLLLLLSIILGTVAISIRIWAVPLEKFVEMMVQ